MGLGSTVSTSQNGPSLKTLLVNELVLDRTMVTDIGLENLKTNTYLLTIVSILQSGLVFLKA